MAAKKLGMQKVPCLYIEGLTDEQRRAYILADNRLTELGDWNMDLVFSELQDLNSFNFDIDLTGFELPDKGDWFSTREKWDNSRQEGNDEYNEFLEKFEDKKTTDDCYTPDNIYEAVAAFVENEYHVDRANFVRPFYPGGDYQAENYKPTNIVVDNPPFSILADIVKWYLERDIKFFLFAPTLTALSADDPRICHIIAGASITYENGAVGNTSFKTNLEDGIAVRTAPALTEAIKIADKENTESGEMLLSYAYPPNLITAAKVGNWGSLLVDYKLPRNACRKISALDAQKEKNLSIFGSGMLLSDAQAAQAAKAAKAAQAAQAAKAAKAAQAAGIPEDQINEDGEIMWALSEREREIIAELNAQEAQNHA